MPLCRLIFRLDFDYNFDIVDQPGEVMRLIDNHNFSEIKESQQRRGIEGTNISDDGKVASKFTVEPITIVASYEIVDGVEIDKLITDEGFLLLSKLANAICEKFHINEVKRSGIRFFYFDDDYTKDSALSAFRSLINNDLINGIESRLGGIDDYAISLNGMSDEKIKYNFKAGPIKDNEDYGKYFQHITPLMPESSSWNFMIDADLYEQNIAISKIPMHKWFRPKIEKSANLIKQVKSAIEKKMDN